MGSMCCRDSHESLSNGAIEEYQLRDLRYRLQCDRLNSGQLSHFGPFGGCYPAKCGSDVKHTSSPSTLSSSKYVLSSPSDSLGLNSKPFRQHPNVCDSQDDGDVTVISLE